ncbi:MAG TPA: alpha/beta fold hydrolase [Solirubrobacteraceae bacterium]|jgi:polyhydroxyalkanoate synthase
MEASTSSAPLDAIRREAQRSLFRARNGIQLIAGTRQPVVGATPKDVVWRRGKAQLYRYRSDKRTRRPPLMIVWSVVSRAYILDLRPGHSFVEQLLDDGIDVFMIDWGVPDAVDAGNTLELYVDNYLPLALERAMEESDSSEIDLLGYCFGGVLSCLAVAAYPEIPVRNLAVMATPVDLKPIEGLIRAFDRGALEVDDLLDETGNLPADAVYRGFASLRPTTDIFKYANLWERLWNDEFVDGYQAMAGWIRDQTPLPGALAHQMVDLLLRRNILTTGEIPLGGRTVRLADIKCPLLNVMAETDHMVPPASSEMLGQLVGSSDVTDLRIPAGHIGLAAGRDAKRNTVPRILEWLNAHSS